MNEFKILSGLELVNYRYPLTDVSHLSEEEKKELLKRGMRIPKQLKSDGEFEQWVALYALWEAEDPYVFTSEGEQVCLDENEKEQLLMDTVSYQRAMWYHKNVSTLGLKRDYSLWLMSWLKPQKLPLNMTDVSFMSWNIINCVV